MGFLDRLAGGGDDDGRRDASIAAVEAGGLPLNAQQRLKELAADPDALFTSNLSVNGFVVGHQLGLDPICHVMGSSVYKVGWQAQGWNTGELTVQSGALNDSRRLALGRLHQEAALAGADAVVGVTVARGAHEFVSDGVEFVAQGTAVRDPRRPANGNPALTDLSLADYATLLRSGHEPVGVVAASTVYYVRASWSTRRAQGGLLSSWRNQELEEFTQGVYTARELALGHLQAQATQIGAEGIVGVQIDEEARAHEVQSPTGGDRTDLIVTFHIIGTAIREAGVPEVTIRPTVSQGAPRP